MSLDRRLREGVGRMTAGIDPDVERHLHTSLRSGRRRILVRRASSIVGAMGAIALIAVVGPRLIDWLELGSRPASRPSPSAIGAGTIAGTYTLTVEAGPEVVDALGLAGEWTFELLADGSMAISPPPGLAVAAEHTFTISDGRFITSAFANDLCNEAEGQGHALGTYGIELVGEDLVLDAQNDFCLARVEILDDAILRAAE
jgi:hypothetical protein